MSVQYSMYLLFFHCKCTVFSVHFTLFFTLKFINIHKTLKKQKKFSLLHFLKHIFSPQNYHVSVQCFSQCMFNVFQIFIFFVLNIIKFHIQINKFTQIIFVASSVFSLVLVITGASIHTTLPGGSLVPLPPTGHQPVTTHSHLSLIHAADCSLPNTQPSAIHASSARHDTQASVTHSCRRLLTAPLNTPTASVYIHRHS